MEINFRRDLRGFIKFSPKTLDNTVFFGMLIGFLAILGYSLGVNESSNKLLFFIFLFSAASYISGFFLGILFGIPKRNNNTISDYNLSNNLVDISDWLTKIIIGLGLIEIKKIPAYLQSIGEFVQNAVMPKESSLKVFIVCCIIYFVIFGLYYGYTYMRLFLSCEFRESDDDLLSDREKLDKQEEILTQQNTNPEKLDAFAMKNAAEYGRILRVTKLESEYNFKDWYYKGIVAYGQKDFNKVIACMNDALSKDPARKNVLVPDTYYYLGFSYYELGIHEKSKDFYELIINNYKHYPELANVYFNLGLALIELKQYQKAIDVYDKALSIEPNIEDAEYNKACLYAILQNKEKMLESLSKAIDEKPAHKREAREDEDFEAFRDDDDFKNLVSD
jgi:tetratricopeptide (TPR) repeat protein